MIVVRRSGVFGLRRGRCENILWMQRKNMMPVAMRASVKGVCGVADAG